MDGLIILWVALGAFSGGGDASPDRPNVVLIMADDLGWGEVGCQGQTKIPTPAIDMVAAEGTRLTSHWSGSPVCAPSRCVLLTGKHPGQGVVRNNMENGGWGPNQPEGQYPLPDAEITLGEILQDHGYTTCAIGKWGLGGPGTEGHPNRQGFDHWFGYLCQRQAHNYYPTHLWRNDEKVPLAGNEWFSAHQKIEAPLESESDYWNRFQGTTFAPDAMRDEAVSFIESRVGEQPFFLYYASPVPHVALQVPPDRLEAFPRDWDKVPYLGQKGYVPHPRPRAAYAAMIAGFDDEVAAIMAALERVGHLDDTIVIVTSDNGPTWAGGVDHTFFESSGPYRGLKGSVFEGGLRVPMIVRWPGRVLAGAVMDLPSGFEDHMPTICEWTGVPRPDGIDGVSLSSALLGGSLPKREWLYRELGGQQALRWGKWKGVRRKLKQGDDSIMLFDLEADPAESMNVAAANPEVIAKIAAMMADAHEPSKVFPLPLIDDPKIEEQTVTTPPS
ncbi:MAG: arylsulfatase [Planctomycetes bacterium]|nr:arylsulfatase [Planctomycetota bacterium]